MSYAVVRISDIAIPQFGTDTCIEWLCFEESEERWYLSEEKHERWEFDLRVDAEVAIGDFGDDFLTVVPIAERPLSPAAIESANWLVNQLAAA